MIRDLWYRFWWHYWAAQERALIGRLEEMNNEDVNRLEERKQIERRLRKATARTTQFGSIQA